MFSYSFAVKLIDRNLAKELEFILFENEGRVIKLERKEADALLVSSEGYSSKREANVAMAAIIMEIKIMLLDLRIPHMDWFSLGISQKTATDVIGSIFEKANIVPQSFRPLSYESRRIKHWPGARSSIPPLALSQLAETLGPELKFASITGDVLEAFTVLGFALAEPFAKSKIILAMTAIELLAQDRKSASDEMIDALEKLQVCCKNLDAMDSVKGRVFEILENAKKESITSACRSLVKDHLGRKKAQEFHDFYNIRSRLVHGDNSARTFGVSQPILTDQDAEDAFTLAFELVKSVAKASPQE